MSNDSFCHIYLVRHGETENNKLGLIQSITDNPLNSTGISQAEKLQKEFNAIDFSAAYSSNLSRAKKTAQIILGSKNIPVIEIKKLTESSVGSWEGKNVTEFIHMIKSNQPPQHLESKEDYLAHPFHPEVETLLSIYTRVATYLKKISAKHLNQKILICSHGGVLASLLHYLDFNKDRDWDIPNCSYLELKASPESLYLERYKGIKFSPCNTLMSDL